MSLEMTENADVLIVGGGLAGWRAAEAAVECGCRVRLIANGAGNSPHIHALNCPVLPEDSVETHARDTLSSGHGTNDPELVRVLCEGAAKLKDEFAFDREPDGAYKLLQPLGSSVPRCVMMGPAVGAEILRRLKAKLADKVEFVEGTVEKVESNDVGRQDEASCPQIRPAVPCVGRTPRPAGPVASLRGQDASSCRNDWLAVIDRGLLGEGQTPVSSTQTFEAHCVIIATGGWCGRYEFSTNPKYLKGDGIRLAEALGAATVDMDQVQYEPTAALEPAVLRGIPVITTMLFEGATFRNRNGEEFLTDKTVNKDELSKAIFREVAAGRGVRGGVWYDATQVARELLTTKYAPLVKRYADAGVDITKEWMLVAPAPHTSLGGLRIDADCRVLDRAGAPIPGLFAVGEVTGGVHGANRLGGNAGSEVLVFGRIAGLSAAKFAKGDQS